ncbi:RNase P subunit p30-domain-containing protein [Pavlovales sp. CCMP2436]|nr:RNase P subunit p30-domain-containing protein [Pavlovales sp. CCMP2436]|mmetsp:Transcript_4631/g.11887  ORF Transcript_4631/g.11887 Transcript_4631/m.11887 type:complete len:248 (+) Transcript_4631:79-822(+)
MDLDLQCASKPDVQAQLRETARSLGYETVAWAREVNGRLGKQHACQPPPAAASAGAPVAQKLALHGGPPAVRQLTRITLVVERTEQLQDINEANPVLAGYDLVAVVPHSEDVLARCCQPPVSNAIDLISLPMEHRLAYALNPAMLRKAARAGVHFEIRYSHALRDSNTRRHLIANALGLVRAAPAYSLVITSGAESDAKLRALADVAHLATLFDMSVHQARRCLTAHARATIERAEARRARRGQGPA